jgi:membrane-bound serine protease (ClpP class)
MDPNIGGIVISPWVIVLIVIAAIAFLIVTIIWGLKAHRLKVAAGKEDMIGRTARVVTPLEPKGLVFLEGEQWTAISESDRIEPGREVVITRIDGLKLYVTEK